MLKKTIKYTDYNDKERIEDFYFNLSQAETTEMELSKDGGLSAVIKKLIAEQNMPKIIEIFKDLVLRAYGEKSLDGRKFVKNQALRDDFSQTEAYSIIFMELATDANAAATFVNGITPNVKIPAATSTPIQSV